MKAPGPAERTYIAFGACAVAGFALLFAAWWGASDTLLVPLQIPWLVSAGFSGVVLACVGLVVLAVYDERRAAADRRESAGLIVREVDALVGNLLRVVEGPRRGPMRKSATRKAPRRKTAKRKPAARA